MAAVENSSLPTATINRGSIVPHHPLTSNTSLHESPAGKNVKIRRSSSVMSKPGQLVSIDDHNPEEDNSNPFKVPADQDIFVLRDKERNKRKNDRDQQQGLAIWEKQTYTSRIMAGTAATRKAALTIEDDGNGDGNDDAAWTLNVTRADRSVDREDLTEYVNKKREMFLVQYSLRVKKDEMKKLEDLALAEEQKLERAEQYLEEDATMFDEFLKENDRNSVEAIKIAEQETKAKLEKVLEIKKSHALLMAIRSEISKHEEVLKEYLLYKQFLEKLSPQEWNAERLKLRMERLRLRPPPPQAVPQKVQQMHVPSSPQVNSRRTPTAQSSKRSVGKSSSRRVKSHASSLGKQSREKAPSAKRSVTDTDSVRSVDTNQTAVAAAEEESDDEPELFFTDPMQLLNIFAELEEDNLSLITNSQETEEAMEEIKQSLRVTKNKMSRQTEQLKTQIHILKTTIDREEERANLLEVKCKMFNFGEFQVADEDMTLNKLNKKVEDVYGSCIGDNEASIASLQMLTAIENRLEELFDNIDKMPPHLVEAAEKAKEKERRMRMREEKILQQKVHQEERVKKALERSKADPKRKQGKRLVFRSQPPQLKQKDHKKKESENKKEEEEMYYFT